MLPRGSITCLKAKIPLSGEAKGRQKMDRREANKIVHDIIVIGASAGGIKALTTLVALLPAELQASLFIVQHLSPTFSSRLSEILSLSGSLPAHQVAKGMLIKRGTIYVAPPDHHLLLLKGSLHLGTGPKEQYVRPAADVLFRSATLVYGPRVIGAILSGRGGDGTAGLHAVKLYGGITAVQDPAEAAWSSMP